jgi:hypothetical protein
MEVQVNYNPLVSVGFLSVNVPQDVLNLVEREIEQMLANNFNNSNEMNNRLYGAIEKEFMLTTCCDKVGRFVDLIGRQYWKFTPFEENSTKKHVMNALWVNFQKKYEFNPLHVHTGSDLSFVIWINIPYNLDLEKNHPSVIKTNGFIHSTTAFSFVYPDPYIRGGVNLKYIQIDKSYEGKMILFPSSLQHQVYPFFTSDEYRISIAGNIKLED